MNIQPQNRQVNPIVSFNAFMQKHKAQLELALPKHLNADRMIRLSLTAFSQNPTLQKCDPKTIFGSIVIASQLGLEIGVNGQGYLVPYKNKCSFIPGWKGLVDLANRGGRCTVWTGAVYEGDEFDYMLGDSPYCKHKPCGEFDESKLTHVYAIGRVKDSEVPVIEVWPIKKVHAHFKKTVVPKLQQDHYSKKHFEAYAKKVALLQVLKYMPQSIEMSNAIDVSYATEQGKNIIIDGDFVTIEQDVEQATYADSPSYQSHQINEINEQQEQQQVQEESVKPTFAMIKHSILTVKSPAHLDFCEEQALDHDHNEERKQLMLLVRAQREKFTPQVTTAPIVEKKQSGQSDIVITEQTNVTTSEESLVSKESKPEPKKKNPLDVRKQYLVEINQAETIAELNELYERFIIDDRLNETQISYLKDSRDQKKQELQKAAEPKIKEKLMTMIENATSIEELKKTVAPQMTANKDKLTEPEMQVLRQAYADKTHFIESQMNLLESWIDGALARIAQAQNIDDIHAEYTDPAYDELSDTDKQRFDLAAQKREAELQH